MVRNMDSAEELRHGLSGAPITPGPGLPRLLGGRLCLDFVNTIAFRHAAALELLADYGDLVAWGKHAGAVGDEDAAALLRLAAADPARAAQAHRRARVVREALYGVFAAAARGVAVPSTDLDIANASIAAAMARARLVPSGRGFVWSWPDYGGRRDAVLWPVVWSAAELLTTPDLDRVKQCPAPDGCGWLFLDTSKNRSRRWCSMDYCGNRAKARRHYARRKQSSD
jgi:predicted RNA-binding Zn ribbon-like protein